MSKLVLVRHGQSQWNLENRFTGWVDVPLSSKGVEEAIKAGVHLKDYRFTHVYVSHLHRAIQTLNYILLESTDSRIPIFNHSDPSVAKWEHHRGEIDRELPVFKNPAIAERYYGDLQGLNKEKTKQRFGEEQVHLWRRSFDVAPPNGESLKDTCERTIPYYKEHIESDLRHGHDILVVAHGNSLRSIIMHLESISEDDIPALEIPTGVPIIYEFDKDMNLVSKMIPD